MSELAPLGPAHAGLIAGMHHVCFAEPWSEKAMAELLALPGVYGWLAAGEQPEGFVLARVAADEAEILTILVLPPYRRQGVAERLLGAAFDNAKMQGAEKMYLEVASSNESAQQLYTKVGFTLVGRRKAYYASGADALLLARDI
jgi:[ribosomal protein S18]-alanine N-acetyltransferase